MCVSVLLSRRKSIQIVLVHIVAYQVKSSEKLWLKRFNFNVVQSVHIGQRSQADIVKM